jgi:hypothetical protein
MAENYVTVSAQWTDGTNFAEGAFQFIASGQLMESTSIAIVTPTIQGQLDEQGSLSVRHLSSPLNLMNSAAAMNSGIPMLASDNFGSGELTWDFRLQVQGITSIFVTDVVLDYSLGASQGLFGILEAAGWSADPT